MSRNTKRKINPVNVRKTTERYDPDYDQGLSKEQVETHKRDGWTNTSVEVFEKSNGQIIRENICTYFNLIFLVLSILLVIARSFRNLSFLPVIIINTLIGIIQEIRAKKVLAKLTILNAPRTIAIRDGKEQSIPSEELVIDDIVLFSAGNQISADAEVVSGEIQVNESLLTGESDEITKKKGDSLMSGSFVVSGTCHAKLVKVGEDSYISRLTMEAKETVNKEESEMIRSLNSLVKWVGIAIIPIGIILFTQGYIWNKSGFSKSVTSMVAAVIGMIPEGLYLLATVALAVSSIRLATQNVLLHNMKSIETLARVNILCVDKTGTITENKMAVQELIESSWYKKYKAVTESPILNLTELISDFAAAMDNDNITMEALKEHFTDTTGRKSVSRTSFSSVVKYSSVTYKEDAYVLGAPEMVLREDYPLYQDEIVPYAEKGYRVLVFGRYEGVIDGKALTGKVIPYGYLTLANPIRKNAKDTFGYFAKQGVNVKVISGDNPVTVSEVASQAGIEGAGRYIDASTLKTSGQISDALNKYNVFGRVTPDQKRAFVKALQKSGNTVAMTGDGVNDVLALKDADCSIAIASGSDAAKQAAQVVLLDSDFSHMPSVVMEGRRVVNNIQRSASLFLVKNIFSFLLAILSAVFMISYPMEPSQISLISAFTIGIPGFFLALEPNKSRIQGNFIINVLVKALPAALTDVIAVGALVLCGHVFNLPDEAVSTAATLLLAVVGFMILYQISRPLSILRGAVLFGNIIALVFCGIVFNKLFAMNQMSKMVILLFIMFSFASESLLRCLNNLVDYLKSTCKKATTGR